MGNFSGFGDFKGDDFREHIKNSILGYDDMYKMALSMAEYFIQAGEKHVDIGCSDGGLVFDMQKRGFNAVGIEIGKNFNNHHRKMGINVMNGDCLDFDYSPYGYVTMMFVLQFLKNGDREQILEKLYKELKEGSGVFITEKTYLENSSVQNMANSIYYEFKQDSFSNDEIMQKEQKLRRIMYLWQEKEIIEKLKKIGFSKVETVYKNMMFVGILAVK